MTFSISPRLLTLSLAGVVGCCVLGFYGTSGAQQQTPPPFANAVELQAEIVGQLKELNLQMKEQNALLRSGHLQVIVIEKNAAEKISVERKRH
jgi:hypothetical protein